MGGDDGEGNVKGRKMGLLIEETFGRDWWVIGSVHRGNQEVGPRVNEGAGHQEVK